ncbi:MAG: PDZ domain-containing protein [Planctomycetes bacterium]|nr:PDZ domain-containing protein [Planctomycetota bacterium]MCH9725423.1 PDZ domain-containing protein [Planctomycetota bacterium]MCH9776520.1 PDZ domain-containing protein [Planctomycetota bacterium]MCH9790767.1 PDZ domain-containing protein [Planctomycetota bacterium]
MSSRLILIAGSVLVASLMFHNALSAAEEPAKLPQQAIEYILDLESEDFQTREKATRTLPDYGEPVIEPLMKVTRGDSLEASVRAILVLEQIYVKGKENSVAKAEDALDQLTRAKNPSVAIRAEEAIDRHADIRKKRAVREIKKMGGNVRLWTAKSIAEAQASSRAVPGQVRFIVLGARWTGKEHGLRFLKRVGRFEALYLIKGHPFTGPAMDDLVKGLSGTPHQIRDSEAMLGIGNGGNFNERGGCIVGGVTEGLAAQKAGIRTDDIIVKFDGQPVPNFEGLVTLIGKKAAYDTVEVELFRDRKLKTLKVTLSSWLDQ